MTKSELIAELEAFQDDDYVAVMVTFREPRFNVFGERTCTQGQHAIQGVQAVKAWHGDKHFAGIMIGEDNLEVNATLDGAK